MLVSLAWRYQTILLPNKEPRGNSPSAPVTLSVNPIPNRGPTLDTAASYNDKVVRQFAIMTVVWGIVGMLVGVIIAAQLIWPR